jgi:hypothetical protein
MPKKSQATQSVSFLFSRLSITNNKIYFRQPTSQLTNWLLVCSQPKKKEKKERGVMARQTVVCVCADLWRQAMVIAVRMHKVTGSRSQGRPPFNFMSCFIFKENKPCSSFLLFRLLSLRSFTAASRRRRRRHPTRAAAVGGRCFHDQTNGSFIITSRPPSPTRSTSIPPRGLLQ